MIMSKFRKLLAAVLCVVLVSGVAWGQSLGLMAVYNSYEALNQQGRYAEAEPYAKEALRLGTKEFGPDHPTTATLLDNLAALYRAQGKYAKAEPLERRALAIWEEARGQLSELDEAYNQYGALFQQGAYSAADAYAKEALRLATKEFGPDHQTTATFVNNLALLRKKQGKYVEAEALYQRALATWKKALGDEHPNVATGLENYAVLLRKVGRGDQAESMEARARVIRAKYE